MTFASLSIIQPVGQAFCFKHCWCIPQASITKTRIDLVVVPAASQGGTCISATSEAAVNAKIPSRSYVLTEHKSVVGFSRPKRWVERSLPPGWCDIENQVLYFPGLSSICLTSVLPFLRSPWFDSVLHWVHVWADTSKTQIVQSPTWARHWCTCALWTYTQPTHVTPFSRLMDTDLGQRASRLNLHTIHARISTNSIWTVMGPTFWTIFVASPTTGKCRCPKHGKQ